MKPLKALLVEDSEMDERLLLRQLAKAGYDVQSTRVQTAAELEHALAEHEWDIVLSDYVMPGFSGLDALTVLKKSGQDIPLIIISGIIGEETAVEAMRLGVHDYLMKDKLTRLAPAIERELENAASRRAQKQAEESLRRSEKNLASAQRIAHIGSWETDLVNNRLCWSDEVYRIFGVSKDDFDTTLESFINFIHPEDRQSVQDCADAALSQNAEYDIEHRIVRPDGEIRIVCEMGEVTFDESGNPVRFIGTVQDITERKAAETEMRLMKSAVDSIGEGIVVTDARKTANPIIYTNTAFENLSGYAFEEVKGQNCRFMQGAETNPQTIDEIREALEKVTTFRGEILNYRKNGESFWNDLSITPIFDPSGHLTNFVGVQQDISERKQSAGILRASEAKIRQLVDSNIIGITTTRLDGSILEANDVFLKTVGYSRQDLLDGKLRWDEMTPPEIFWQDERAKKQLAEFGYSIPREKEYIRKDGSRVPVMVGGTLLKGTENTVIAFVLDISERKQAEEKLQQSEASLANAQRIAHIGSWDVDLIKNKLSWSEEVYRIFGLPKTQFGGNYEAFFNTIHPEDREKVQSAMDATLSQFAPYSVEHRIIRPDGEERIVIELAEITFDESGKPLYLIGTVQDITDRKQAEEKLREREEWLRAVLDGSRDGIVIEDGPEISYINKSYGQLLGYHSAEELVGKQISDLLPADEAERLTEYGERRRRGEEAPTVYEFKGKHKDGNLIELEGAVSTSVISGRKFILTAIRDITERKQIEKALRRSEERYRLLIENAKDIIYTLDLSGRFTSLNRAGEQITGYPRDQALPISIADVVSPSDLKLVRERIAKNLSGAQQPNFELEITGKSGNKVLLDISSRIIYQDGAAVGIQGIGRDITERKRAEVALRESEIRMRTILDTEPECVKVLGFRGEVLEMNPAGLAMIEADSLEQILGLKAVKIVAPEHRRAFAETTKKVLAGSSEILEFEIIGIKGTRRRLETHAVPMRNQEGEITSLLAITRDITDRKRIEEEKALLTVQIERQHERLNNILANVPGVVWEAWGEPDSATQRIGFVSDYVETMLGYTVEEWLTTPNFWLSIVHPADKEWIAREAVERFVTGESDTKQFRWIAKDGRIVWVESKATVIRDEAGQPIGLRGINTDITERKRLEDERTKLAAELASEKARLQHIFDNSPSFIVSMSGPKFVFEMANPAYYRLVGQRDLIGIPAIEALPEIMTQGLPEIIRQVYSTGEPFIGNEVPLKLQLIKSSEPKQHYINFVYMPQREADDSISGIISYGIDVTEQVLSRIKIQESEERYRFLFENNPLPMWVFDVETLEFLSVNDAAIQHYGYSEEEFLTMNLKDIRPPEEITNLLEHTGKSFSGIDKAGVFKHLTKSGTAIDVEIISKQLIFNGKNAELVLANDTTERRKAQESVRFQAQLLNTVEQSVIATDLNGIVTYWNQFAEKLYGWTYAEALGREIRELTTPEINLEQANLIMTRLKEGKGWTGEFIVQNKAGASFPAYVSNSPVHDITGKLVGIVGVSMDITERKNAETGLRQAEDKYRGLVESTPAIVYLNKPHPPYSTVYVSPNIKVFGYSPEEWYAEQRMWVSMLHEEDRERVVREFDFAARHDLETDLEYRITARDGKIYWWKDKGRFIKDEEGNKIGWQGVILDVTKTKELEEQLRQSQKLESVGRMAGGIAHDFNNMLTAINGYSELTLRQLEADNPLRQNIEEIKKAGERSAQLTHQLLAFSRQQVLKPVVINLSVVITDTIKLLERLIGEDIKLVIALNPKTGRVNVDPGQLSQIIMNLAVNARDAMPHGGRLTIETANVFLKPQDARQKEGILSGAYVMLAVCDTGQGIDDKIQKQIFEPFFTTKELGKGTGLGLATVYGIVKQSGGNIEFDSQAGVGTTFRIYLPRVAEQSETMETADTSAQFLAGTETILLVEDEELVRNLSKAMLETCGYTVIEARDGLEALKIFAAGDCQPDLLMTDVVMPQMGGRELAEKIKEKMPDIKILFTSGYTDDAVVRHGVIEINTNFISKPFTFDDLSRKVRKILDAEDSKVMQ
jgi:two-component system cell cycle sensor histidine kinase/response regulator CckA